MKRTVIIALLTFSFAACNNNDGKNKDLSGNYVRETKDEYARVRDTLYISKASNSSESLYKIVEGSETEHYKMLEGMTSPVEHQKENFTGNYNKKDQTLRIEEKGLTYSVDLDKGRITNGKVTFTRIK